MLLGAFVSWALIAPWLLELEVIDAIRYSRAVKWTMWPATAMLVAAGLTSLVLSGRTLLGAFASMARARSSLRGGGIEVPFRSWLAILVVACAVVLAMMALQFGIPLWAGLLSIVLAFVMAMMATRAVGETNQNPMGAMGHVAQTVHAGSAGGAAGANVLAGGVTAGAASQAADMMQDLKTGYLLGATPRRQFLGQLLGVIVGSLVGVPAFLLIARVYGIGPESETFPAPSGISWSVFARTLSEGFSALPAHALPAMAIAAAVGVLLALPPRRVRNWLPTPIGLGIALIAPGHFSLTIALGGVIALALRLAAPRFAASSLMVLGGGLIVGEAVMASAGLTLHVFDLATVLWWIAIALPLLVLALVPPVVILSLRRLSRSGRSS
jgi:uncharacterized oligopeptide transporter (OPT) family protein